MRSDEIREARLTSVAIIRETLRGNDRGVAQLVAGYEGDAEDLIFPLASVAAAMVVPASQATDPPTTPWAILDSMTATMVGDAGGVPGEELQRRLDERKDDGME